MYCTWYGATFSSPLISTEMCNRMAPDTADLSVRFSKLYQTSISPDSVRTSIMVWPKKSSDSRVNFCRNFDFKSLSSSHTRTFIRSDELWHSLIEHSTPNVCIVNDIPWRNACVFLGFSKWFKEINDEKERNFWIHQREKKRRKSVLLEMNEWMMNSTYRGELK